MNPDQYNIIINKLDTLKERIEDWASTNGYENLENSDERKNTETGELIWRRTDWEYVDDTYNTMINDEGFYPGKICFKKMNEQSAGTPNFSTFYYCYKMNLPRDIVWL